MNEEPVSLEDIKVHLKLDLSDESEDEYLKSLILGARRSVERYTTRTIIGLQEIDGDDLESAKHAIRLIVGSWYANREGVVVGSQVTTLPMAVTWLLNPLRRFASE